MIGGPFFEESKATLKDILEKAKTLKKIKAHTKKPKL